jgi:CheY-like chemotaxis protein
MANNKRRRILVVDDIEDWRVTLSGLLLDEGYEVEVADSSANALALLDAHTFDLALLDVRLVESEDGNTEGLTLASKIRDIRPRVKIVFITGYDTPEMVRQAREPDANGLTLAEDLIPKHKTESLLQVIEEVLVQE